MTHGSRDGERLWVVSELYYPEETSTGYILTRIAEGLAKSRSVRVVCGQPSYSARGLRAPWREVRRSVEIERCWAPNWNKDNLTLRAVNLIVISLSMFLRLLRRVRRNDQVMVVTNPPLLPFVASCACWLKGAQCLLLIHDVYPEVLVATGMARSGSAIMKVTDWFVRRLYRSVDRIIVLGRDMQELVRAKLPNSDHDKVAIITNWADVDLVCPMPREQNRLMKELGLTNKFVIQYAGNMGRSHDIEGVLRCAEQLRHEKSLHFLMIGSGAKKAWLRRTVQEKELTNITILNHRPRSQQCDFLNACDVSIIAFVSGMAGVSVPSRMYNVLAAGKPIVAVADQESELARVVEEEEVGWVIEPGDVEACAQAILESLSQNRRLQEMGRRAQRAVERKYRLERIIGDYGSLIAPSLSDETVGDGVLRRAA